MRAVAYGHNGQEGLAALVAGLSAIGCKVELLDGQEFRRFTPDGSHDLAIIEGVRSRNRFILDSYRRNSKTPIICVEYGYLNRARNKETHEAGYWQVSIGKLGWAPPDQCPSDRWEALSLKLGEWRYGAPDRPVLVCGDHPGVPDMAEDFRLPEVEAWAASALDGLRRRTKRRIFWRPHPRTARGVPGFDGYSDGRVDLSDYHAVICHRSNIGNEALLAGCPVISDGDAAYAEVASRSLSEIENPKKPDREEYFARLAYGQWTLKEMSSGAPIRFYKDRGYL